MATCGNQQTHQLHSLLGRELSFALAEI